jgi:hypothetical protein
MSLRERNFYYIVLSGYYSDGSGRPTLTYFDAEDDAELEAMHVFIITAARTTQIVKVFKSWEKPEAQT